MSWKARLDHLIADGEHAAYLESREILDALLAQSEDERWRVILERDPRLERLIPLDYEWLLKATVTTKPSAVAEALATQAAQWGEQWQPYVQQLTIAVESSLTQRLEQQTQDLVKTVTSAQAQWAERLEQRLDWRWPLRLLLLVVVTLGVVTWVMRGTDLLSSSPVAGSSLTVVHNQEELAKIIASFQAHWRVQEANWFNVPAWLWLLGLLLIPGVVFAWVMLRAKATAWPNFRTEGKNQDFVKMVLASQAKWSERLEQHTENLLHAVEASQNNMETHLTQLIRETSVRQERQHDMFWKVMAMEELGLKLIAGSDFHAEFMALRAAWGESELLLQLSPAAMHGAPGRPLLFMTLEHLYGELLIQQEHQPAPSFWRTRWPFSNPVSHPPTEKIEQRVANALRELRRGNWQAGIEAVTGIDHPQIAHWTHTARTRLILEEWYNQLRQEVWGHHLDMERYPSVVSAKKYLVSATCAKTCHIPFCQPNKLCLKQLLLRCKNS